MSRVKLACANAAELVAKLNAARIKYDFIVSPKKPYRYLEKPTNGRRQRGYLNARTLTDKAYQPNISFAESPEGVTAEVFGGARASVVLGADGIICKKEKTAGSLRQRSAVRTVSENGCGGRI